MTARMNTEAKEVLVVDDDSVVLKSCKRIIESEHETWNITTATSVKEAYQALSKNSFSLLIIDVMMPAEDGCELIKQAKQWDPKVPVLAMSGYPTAEVTKRCTEKGADLFIPKPFTPDELIKAIESLVTGG